MKGILFLQDNAAVHKVGIMHQKLTVLHPIVLRHLDYSPDLALGSGYSSTEEAMLAADEWFAAQPNIFFLVGLNKLEQESDKHVELREHYVQ